MTSLLRKISPARDPEIRYTDFHCHILPGLDDGAKSEEASLNIARMARESGAKRILATPHFMPGVFSPTPAAIREAVARLTSRVREAGLDLEILEGSEVALTEWLARDYKEGRILPLAGTTFVLLELPSLSLPPHAMDEIFSLKLAGAGVVLAHPERNSDLRQSPDTLREIVETGVYLQVNAGSFVGEYGKDVSTFAAWLLKEDLVHFIGSDAHSGSQADLVRGGPDVQAALRRIFRSVKDREAFVAGVEERVEDLLSGRLR